MFDKVIIANRGIISCRVQETCNKLGLNAIVPYHPVDKNSLHVKNALKNGYKTYSIAGYEKWEQILQIADHYKIGESRIAIHPGYGFLSENPDFARICETHKFIFIGPSSDVIESLGDKIKAIQSAMTAGVPVLPGSHKPVESEKEVKDLFLAMRPPILVKAVGGGGGMGIKSANSLDELIKAYREVRSYAKQHYQTDAVYFEKQLTNYRHIEVQILGDGQGNILVLGERDCTIQRRNQKLIEFSPADISEMLRKNIYEAAIILGKEVGYLNAGTIEFLVDEADNFYFMEANTRVQVEHRVTELRTGMDIIEEQFRIAAGEGLRHRQEDISQKGYAIECRINAEDPESFAPAFGKLTAFKKPKGKNLIVDSHLQKGYEIPINFDSLIANVIAWGETKAEAINRMEEALKGFQIQGKGVKTLLPYHLRKIREI